MKPWYKSKTIWFNVATGLVSFGNEMATVASLIEAEWAGSVRVGLALLIAGGNVILRMITDAAIE